MYPWDVLGIDATDDKKAIKKAYAKLIRQHRPEEAPEKFQEINQAYQYALELLKSGVSVETVPLQTVTTDFPASTQGVKPMLSEPEMQQGLDIQLNDLNHSSDTEQVDLVDQDSLDEINEYDPEVILGNEILEQFHQLAFAEYRIKKQAKNWAFLEQYHEIQDLQLRDSLSKELFKRVVEYNRFQQQENGTLLLNQTTVNIVADILGWESQWQEFEQTFPEPYVAHVFSLIESLNSEKKSGHLYLRIFSIVLEILAVNLTVTLFGLDEIGLSREFVFIILFMLFNSFSSLTTNHLPAIQYMFDFRLFDKFLNQPKIKQKLVRLITFHVLMIPVYLIFLFEGVRFSSPLAEIICSLIISANAITWFKNKQLFHDWISGTIMMK